MRVKNASLICVAGNPKQFPPSDKREFALVGRSNVGKSSLINRITKNSKLAKTSNTPGKTRTINFYSINDDDFRIVDLPGYGYIKNTKDDSKKWKSLIESYLKERMSLEKIILLLDCRHKPSVQDKEMFDFINYYGKGGLICLTKADKLSRNELNKNIKMIRDFLQTDDEMISTSSLKGTNIDDFITALIN